MFKTPITFYLPFLLYFVEEALNKHIYKLVEQRKIKYITSSNTIIPTHTFFVDVLIVFAKPLEGMKQTSKIFFKIMDKNWTPYESSQVQDNRSWS